MRTETLSIRTLTVGVLLVLGIVPIAHTLMAKLHFRDAALESKVKSLSRVVEVAAREVLNNMEADMIESANAVQARPDLRTAYRQAVEGNLEPLKEALDDPFRKGFVSARLIDLAKLRVYGADHRPLAQSRLGQTGIGPDLPPFLRERVHNRTGVDRLKAIGGLWRSPDGPRYSIVVPVGGLHAEGYLELVADPIYNLARVGDMVQLPLAIDAIDGDRLFQSERFQETEEHLPVPYLLRDETGAPLLRLQIFENVADLYADMHNTQVVMTIGFVGLTVLTLLLAVWLLGRFVVDPVRVLAEDMERCRRGDLCFSREGHCLKEISTLFKMFREMTRELKARSDQLERQTLEDALTGIANRRHFDAALESEWRRAVRNRTRLALLLIDIDEFKAYNDTLGHPAGDACLRQVAQTLEASVTRAGDLVARYGGEEFAVILPNTDEHGAREIAARIRQELKLHQIAHPSSRVAPVLTVSIGLAIAQPEQTAVVADLVIAADAALYEAKAAGRNRISIAAPHRRPQPPGSEQIA